MTRPSPRTDIDQLAHVADLKEAGAISDKEFEMAKKEIVGGSTRNIGFMLQYARQLRERGEIKDPAYESAKEQIFSGATVVSYGNGDININLSERPSDTERSKTADRLRWAYGAGLLEGDLSAKLEEALTCNSRSQLNQMVSEYSAYPDDFDTSKDVDTLRTRAHKVLSKAHTEARITSEEMMAMEDKIGEMSDVGSIYRFMKGAGANVMSGGEKRLYSQAVRWVDLWDAEFPACWWLFGLIPLIALNITYLVIATASHSRSPFYTPVWGAIFGGIDILAGIWAAYLIGHSNFAGVEKGSRYETIRLQLRKRRRQWKWYGLALAPIAALVAYFYVPVFMHAL